MNILFLSLGKYYSINEHEIYADLLREFVKHGHRVYIVSPCERREGKPRQKLIREHSSEILKVRTGNIQKTNIIEKGISTLLIEPQFLHAVKKHYKDVKFHLALYPTPPITFVNVVKYLKKRDGAKTYLLLKDIFPQNAADIGMMNKKGMLYKYFRNKERKLYCVSDYIGCMSEANAQYVLEHNPEVTERNNRAIEESGKGIVEVCPNSIEPIDMSITLKEREELRNRYHIPQDKIVFIYGGNLGKPQGIPFMLKCLHSVRNIARGFFVIVGSGTEYGRIEQYMEKYRPENILLYRSLPKEDYDKLVAACDVGMIFLDHRFTIPNFPSRLLGYMQAKLPVLACTDPNTDIGKIIVDNGFGWWCESDSADSFKEKISEIINSPISTPGEAGYQYLLKHYTVQRGYEIIMEAYGRGSYENSTDKYHL